MAYNVGISAIFLGNRPDIDTNETNYRAENANSLLGTYGSESDPLYKDRLTLTTNSSKNDLDVDHHHTGLGTFTYDVGAGTVTTSLDIIVLYNATVTFNDGTTTTVQLDTIQTLTGDVFALPWDGYAILGSQGIKSITLTSKAGDDYAGIYQTDYDNVQFVCFATGTRIKVPQGETCVENLRIGDLVETQDHGAQQIRWIGARHLRFPGSPETQKPVEFKAGALGRGLPQRTLVVSPQHRIAVCGGVRLAAAHCLEGLDGVRRMKGKQAVTYVSLLCDRHEIIFAEGAAVESLYPGPLAFAVLSPIQRLQVLARLPAIRQGGSEGYGPFARPVLEPIEARTWARRAAPATACLLTG